MNTKTKSYVDGIKNAESTYLDKAENILLRYREEKEKVYTVAGKFKDEKSYIDERMPEVKQSAREALARAEETFRKEIVRCNAGLKAELKSSISTSVPKEFTDRLGFYRASGITPTKTEVETLLDIGQKSPLAVKALQKLCEDTSSDVRIEARSIEDYENDLANLEDLEEMPLVSAPFSVHTELVEILRGTPKPTKTSAGWRDAGETWQDSVSVLLQTTAVSMRIKALENVADSWTSDITCVAREKEFKADMAKEKEIAEIAGLEFKPQSEPESSTRITQQNEDGIELAKQLGREKARTAMTAKDLKAYEK